MGLLNAVDLQTVAATPISAHQRGYEDAAYQGVYYNPFRLGSQEWWEYDQGHSDGRQALEAEGEEGLQDDDFVRGSGAGADDPGGGVAAQRSRPRMKAADIEGLDDGALSTLIGTRRADLAYAKLMLRQSTGVAARVQWRTEIGQLSDVIRRLEQEQERRRRQ